MRRDHAPLVAQVFTLGRVGQRVFLAFLLLPLALLFADFGDPVVQGVRVETCVDLAPRLSLDPDHLGLDALLEDLVQHLGVLRHEFTDLYQLWRYIPSMLLH